MIEDISPGNSQTSAERRDSQTQRFTHEWSQSQSIGVSIVRAVATVADVDSLSLQPRLYDVIDPDALETLVSSSSTESDVRITFQFGVYEVTVTQTGTIWVRDDTSRFSN